MAEAKEVAQNVQGGALYESLARGSKQVRLDRGEDLVENLKTVYKRKVEDIEMDINTKRRQQSRMFDFSGTSTTSLVVKDINAKEIMDTDLALELEIHNLNVKLEHAQRRLNHLFVKAQS